MDMSSQINELVSALSKCQGEMKPAVKDSTNPHFKSKFATLNSIWDSCREPLSRNGLSVIQTMSKDDKGSTLMVTILAHSSGQWIKSLYSIACKDPNNPQAWGSAITYARRYTLSAIIGICTDDDDDAQKASYHPQSNSEPRGRDRATYPQRMEKNETITQEQWKELHDVIDQCDSTTKQQVLSHLSQHGISSFSDMKTSSFMKIKHWCLKNIETNKESESFYEQAV